MNVTVNFENSFKMTKTNPVQLRLTSSNKCAQDKKDWLFSIWLSSWKSVSNPFNLFVVLKGRNLMKIQMNVNNIKGTNVNS
jgi:hypothetical protein